MTNVLLANLIYLIHLGMLMMILIAPFLFPPTYLKYVIVLTIVIMLDWNDIDGMCILTKLEHYFRTGEWANKSAAQGGPEFFRPLMKRWFGWNLTREEADRINYLFLLTSLLICFVRFSKSCSLVRR